MSSSQEVINPDDVSNLISVNTTTKTTVFGSDISQWALAADDLKLGIQQWRVWLLLAYQDIQLRYRRSALGPFWITLSMAITVYSMGFLYAHLFHQDLATYFPYLVGGMLGWALISCIINDITDGLVLSENLVKQIKLPYSLYMHRIATRNILVFFHNIFVIVPILIVYHATAHVNLYTLLLIPSLFIVYVNTVSYGLVISMLGARYRDISQVIKSLLQIVFFVTPVMWNPNVLSDKAQYFIQFNPVYALIELIRQPLLGAAPTMSTLIATGIVTLVGIAMSIIFFTKYRSRIVYWL